MIRHRLRVWISETPVPVWLVVALLYGLVPLSFAVMRGMDIWAMGISPVARLTDPFFYAVGLGRIAGAYVLASLLLWRRTRASIAITITAVWLGGPPVTFLMSGIAILAASAAQASLTRDPIGLVVRASLFPALVTSLLLVPRSMRRADRLSD